MYSIGITTWQKSQDIVYHERLYLVHTICVLLAYFANATNFFMYCASGPQFRKAIKEILLCSVAKKSRSSQNSVPPTAGANITNTIGNDAASVAKKSVAKSTFSENIMDEKQKNNISNQCTGNKMNNNQENDLSHESKR